MRTPSYSLVKSAIAPGDTIFVLDENSKYAPTTVLEIRRKSLLTEAGDLFFDDHGWLWKALRPKEDEIDG